MFRIKCPNCGASIGFLPVAFKLYRQERRECSACGTQVKLSSPKYLDVLFGALYGLILAGVLIGSEDWEVSFLLKVLIFIVVIFILLFFRFSLVRWEEFIEEEKRKEEKK